MEVIRPGTRVLGDDGVEVGRVEQVLVSPDGRDARLLLSGGQIRLSPEVIGLVGRDELYLKLSASTARDTDWGPVPEGYTPADTFAVGRGGEIESVTLPRYEERLIAEKRWTEIGSIRVHKSVVEEPQTLTAEVSHEEYEVERVRVDRPWQPGDDSPRTEGDTIIVPIIAERIEIMRRKVVSGEVRLTRRVATEQRQLTETVRKERVEVSGPAKGDVESGTESGE